MVRGSGYFHLSLLVEPTHTTNHLSPIYFQKQRPCSSKAHFLLLFKIDREILDEIAGMVTTFGLPWSKWL